MKFQARLEAANKGLALARERYTETLTAIAKDTAKTVSKDRRYKGTVITVVTNDIGGFSISADGSRLGAPAFVETLEANEFRETMMRASVTHGPAILPTVYAKFLDGKEIA